MTDATSVNALIEQQKKLQDEFEATQSKLNSLKKEYDKIKATLVEFNNKYGRVIQLLKED